MPMLWVHATPSAARQLVQAVPELVRRPMPSVWASLGWQGASALVLPGLPERRCHPAPRLHHHGLASLADIATDTSRGRG